MFIVAMVLTTSNVVVVPLGVEVILTMPNKDRIVDVFNSNDEILTFFLVPSVVGQRVTGKKAGSTVVELHGRTERIRYLVIVPGN